MSIFRKQDRRNWSLGSTIYYGGYSAADVEKKIDAGGDVNGKFKSDYYTRHMIRWAAERANGEVVKLLLKKGADPNVGSESDSPLLAAVKAASAESVQALLDAGARIDPKSYNGETPLMVAARQGSGDIVKLLADRGADVNAQLKDGNTALHLAASLGFANLSMYLIEKGANPTLTNGNMNMAADVAEKEFPGLAAMIRAKISPEEPKRAEPDPGWRLVATDEVAHVAVKEPIGYRVTEIFNFAARTYTQIAANLDSKAESQSVKAFSELDNSEIVDKAYCELVRLGGRADYADSGKKKLQAPGL